MLKSLKRFGPVFLGPTLFAFTLAFLAPFAIGLYLSLCKFTTVTNASFVGIANYIDAFSASQGFVRALIFTAAVTILSVITVNVFAFAIAYALTRKLKGTNFFRTVFFMPNLIGGIVLGYTWQTIINAVLLHWQTTLVTNATYGFIGIIILLNWQMVGYMMIIYIAGLQAVPKDLIEAAEIDGAGKWLILKNVTIPMVMPSITICLFLTLSNSFKLYDQNLALTNGQPLDMTEMAALNIVNTFFSRVGYEGVGQAKAVVFFLIVSLIAFIQLRATRGKEVEA
ncbi:carbohydrate ABC transporter permease [Schaalia hyovaginalis]|uniref:Raffinose/stachyose/melibiose transport system permease protein n=1 Tax=Schaalia hyovaginalis TaxID=29316 RepID=A0A7K0KAK3_9ACTO|nr:sugar ABC transporter permease [Schaalia hyovaginalis]MBB6334339.1 raffinose/stachyose/melibiose transport system permease protein [Schaalia hyovaginalis]MCI7671128.1 sugar ABC transporter permease [Schaalia hyovaginalis]MDY2668803.1 sugar ABC transporter permease [Schaalia hyovaginalis]MDY3664645.1 sugar ABC transporter permease [Schaalia hyovaginalis]MDY6213232.1 sugar ABC transporter permease [Schaalia hyovaginalis]